MATTTKAATLSIQKDAGYKALEKCAQTCVDRDANNGDLEGHLDCGDLRILDSCFCAADTRPKATAFLSSCVITKCKHDRAELTSVLKLYDGYCDFKPLTTSATTKKSTTTTKSSSSSRKTSSATPAASSSLPASSSEISSLPSSSLESSSTPTISPISTPTPESSTSGSSAAMGPGTIAGIAIGGIAALFLAMSLLMWYCRRGQKDEPHDPYFGRVQKEDPFEPGRGVGATASALAVSPYRDHSGSVSGSGFSSPGQGHGPGAYHDSDAAYVAGGAAAAGVAGGGMYYNHLKGRSAGSSFVSSGRSERGMEPESYDMSAMSPARPVDFTSTTPMMAAMTPPPPVTPGSAASSGGGFPMSPGPVRRKPVPVEMEGGTMFRAELDAGSDGLGAYGGRRGEGQ